MARQLTERADRDETTHHCLKSLCGIPMALGRFLRLAVALADALSELHKRNVIYKNIRPLNIFFDPKAEKILFLEQDLLAPGSSALRSTGNLRSADMAIAYMSPEQVGRIERMVDSRSDLYSLGITLYEMLTGVLPFQAGDLLEWVHCHFARMPKAPVSLVPGTPAVVSDIIMKLLAKNVENRYQSAPGLKLDLQRCLTRYEAGHDIAAFALGQGDISDQLLIPEKLYGRKKETALLFRTFEQVRNQGSQAMLLIAGYSGIGKSSLVRELFRPVVREHGFFIAGKFDHYKRNIPYSTIIEAFQTLIRQILTEPEDQLHVWKQDFQKALGVNGKIIVDIIPQIKLIIGDQPPVPELSVTESENRFRMVLRQFIGVLGRKEHPLVVFLDDLQWADTASLKLIENLITEQDTRYLLLIGAYRDNEVNLVHPLMQTIETIRNSKAALNVISLAALSFEDFGRLLSATLHLNRSELEPLTKLIYEKTAGNPFFGIQFLLTLHSERLLVFSRDTQCWTWDMNRIRAMDYTDNVVDLMTTKLRKLSPNILEALKLAACVGNKFDLHCLAKIRNSTINSVLHDLQEAVRETLLISMQESRYRFIHDRIQQAAYSLIDEDQRMALHLQIGRYMLAQAKPSTIGEMVFDIVNQFNLGASLITERAEKARVAKLDLMAGSKAKDSTAYASALSFLSQGAALLDDKDWESNYELAFELHKELAEVEYINSNYTHSKALINMLLDKAKTDLERAKLYNMLITQHTLMARYTQAIEFGKKALRFLNVDIPEKNLEAELHKEIKNYRKILGDRSILSLIDEPEMTDPRIRVCQAVLANMLVTARYTDNTLFALVAVTSVNLSLKFGPTAKSTVGYTAFGMVLQSVMNNYQEAYDFGELALRISERFNDPAQKCQVCLVLGHYLNHWVKHLKSADHILDEGFQSGLATGEMQWTGYTLAYKLFQPFYRGVEVARIRNEIPGILSFTRKTRNQWATDALLGLQLALSVLEERSSIVLKSKDRFDTVESKYLKKCEEHKSFGALGRYAVLKAQILFLEDRAPEALDCLAKAQELVGFFSSSISVAELNFYSSLVFAALYADASDELKIEYLDKIASNQRQMQIWVEHCEENFRHKSLLVEAELARIKEKFEDAQYLYEQAVQSARAGGFVQNEGLANELAARFHTRRGLATIARAYLQQARSCYVQWGAKGILKQLDQRYPQFEREIPAHTGRTLADEVGDLDAIAVVKASQAISSEIVVSNLIETLMQTVVENAGAQMACLLLAHDKEMVIEAKAVVQGQAVEMVRPESSGIGSILPESIINYVKRTGEVVILDDASGQNLFSADPYIQLNQPISVLCMPLLRQSEMIGMLYLENSLVKKAFTKGRIAVLELLAAQAAISLENAALYQERGRAEQALRVSEAKYRTIFEDSGTPMVFVKEDKTIAIWNKAFEKLSGYRRSQLKGHLKWTKIVARQQDLVRMQEYHHLRRIDPQAAPQTYEFEFITKEGLLKQVMVTVVMMPGTKHSLAALLDITERKRALEELHRSEQKFRAIFDRSFQFMGLMTPEGILLEANKTALEFSEVDESSVIGRPFWKAPWFRHSPELQEKMQAAVKTAAKGKLVRFEATHCGADGDVRHIDFSLKPVMDEAGKIVLLIPEGRDISERKQAEEEQARLVTAIEQSAEAVVITDTNFVIRYANPALERMGGYGRSEIIGRHIRILGSHSQDETFYAQMMETLTSGQVWSGRLFYKRKDGDDYEADSTASPVRDKSGNIINYVSMHRDVTREVQLERQLRQAHKMEAIGTLAGGIAHDFNNILAVIQGHAELMQLQLPATNHFQGSLEKMLLSCSRAKDLVMQILTFSRQTEQEIKPLHLLSLVDEILKLLRSTLPATIVIQRDIHPGAEQSVIMADATQIHQVLMNLATNATQAMGAEGGILGVGLSKVEIGSDHALALEGLPSGSYVRVSVSDTGHGMCSSVIERIFDPYFTTKKLGEGSGMGLAVTQGIVKTHNGAINVCSTPGVGTTFEVFFPHSDAKVAPMPEKDNPLPTGNERILFVDDEETLVDLGQKMLKLLGYSITARTSGLEALEIFRSRPDAFDLVITDMTMPHITGIELAKKLMAIRPDMPVILCTGFSELVMGKQAADYGIREFVMKPYQLAEMAASIRRVLESVKYS